MAKPAKKPGSSDGNTVKLSEVAKLLRLPPGVRDQKVKKGGKNLKLVSITDLPEAGFIEKVDGSITLSMDKYNSIKKNTLQPFDLLMSIQGTVGVVGVVTEKFPGTWMANISLLVVRFAEDKKENSIALLEYLKSSFGTGIIKKLQKGSTIKRVNVKEFAAVKIPRLSAEVKKESAALLAKEIGVMKKIDDLYSSMADLRASYLKGAKQQ